MSRMFRSRVSNQGQMMTAIPSFLVNIYTKSFVPHFSYHIPHPENSSLPRVELKCLCGVGMVKKYEDLWLYKF